MCAAHVQLPCVLLFSVVLVLAPHLVLLVFSLGRAVLLVRFVLWALSLVFLSGRLVACAVTRGGGLGPPGRGL